MRHLGTPATLEQTTLSNAIRRGQHDAKGEPQTSGGLR